MAGNNWNEILSEMAEEAVCRAKEQDKKNWETYARGMAPPPCGDGDARASALQAAVAYWGASNDADVDAVVETARRFERYIVSGE